MEAKIPPEYDYIKYTNNDSRIFSFPFSFFFFLANIGKEGLQFDTAGFFPLKLQMKSHLYHVSFARREHTSNCCQIHMELRRLT